MKKLPGIYELKDVQSYKDGASFSEKVKMSLFTFTKDGKLSVVSATDRMIIAYTGNYSVEEKFLKINVVSSSIKEIEGSTIERRIVNFDESTLVLEATGAKSGICSILTWQKVQNF